MIVAEISYEGELRYRLLEPVRQYARERLEARGDTDNRHRIHTSCYLALAEKVEPKLISAEQLVWLLELDAEHDYLRAALTWALERARDGLATIRGSVAFLVPVELPERRPAVAGAGSGAGRR